MWDYDERKGEGETQCRFIACSSRKAPRGPPGLTSPFDGRITINSTYQQYYMPSQHTYCGRVWNLIQACEYNLAIRKCTSPPLLAPRLKIFKWKFTTTSGIESWTCWTRGRHATIWASAASGLLSVDSEYKCFRSEGLGKNERERDLWLSCDRCPNSSSGKNSWPENRRSVVQIQAWAQIFLLIFIIKSYRVY